MASLHLDKLWTFFACKVPQLRVMCLDGALSQRGLKLYLSERILRSLVYKEDNGACTTKWARLLTAADYNCEKSSSGLHLFDECLLSIVTRRSWKFDPCLSATGTLSQVKERTTPNFTNNEFTQTMLLLTHEPALRASVLASRTPLTRSELYLSVSSDSFWAS